MAEFSSDVLVVGAGISGLVAAREMQRRGRKVTILEKSRGVGGRMATRRIGQAVFDHGAQFFTVRYKSFRELMDEWIAAGVAREWCLGFASADGVMKPDGHPRYCGSPAMTAIPKYMAKDLDVRLETTVGKIEHTDGCWRIADENENVYSAASLLMTAPSMQSMSMLGAGKVALPLDIINALQDIEYDPCHTLLAVLDGPSNIPEPGGLRAPAPEISWIADNTLKGVSPVITAVTIHGSPNFSRQHSVSDAKLVETTLLGAAMPWLGAEPIQTDLHHWVFSQPARVQEERCLYAEAPGPLAFAGDAFGGPRVEGAVLSGLEAAAALLGEPRSKE